MIYIFMKITSSKTTNIKISFFKSLSFFAEINPNFLIKNIHKIYLIILNLI